VMRSRVMWQSWGAVWSAKGHFGYETMLTPSNLVGGINLIINPTGEVCPQVATHSFFGRPFRGCLILC